MTLRKLKNPFRKAQLPVDIRQCRKSRKWDIYDKDSVIIASGMTKGDAEMVRDTLNYIGRVLGYLTELLETEEIMVPSTSDVEKIEERMQLLEEISEFLIQIGLVKRMRPPYEENIKQWGNDLVCKAIGDLPEWTKAYHILKKKREY